MVEKWPKTIQTTKKIVSLYILTENFYLNIQFI